MAGSYFSTDTIAAVATSLAGDGGVGIIRLSGPRSLAVARQVCRGLESPQPRYMHRIEVFQGGGEEPLDDGLGVYFPNGQSFTGEDVVELQLHGGRFLLQSMLQALIATGGCRLALPGEFSFRSVRNGKLTLAGAGARRQLVAARSLFEVRSARRNLGESRRGDFERLAGKLRGLLAQTELSIDFIDQDVEVISPAKMAEEVSELLAIIEDLLGRMNAARRIARGLQVTLIGAPNAGKSTLFNALLSEDRAIVSPEAGTTRDVITEEIALGPYYVRLADTAGIREAGGAVESEGMARAGELAEESDANVLVLDATEPPIVGLLESPLVAGVARASLIVALNKWDLVDRRSRDEWGRVTRDSGAGSVVPVSAAKGEGIERLLDAIRCVLDSRYRMGVDAFLPTEFQLQMLLACRSAVIQVSELLGSTGLSQPELVSAALAAAARALSDLVGETTPDTVLAKIFSEFCIGK